MPQEKDFSLTSANGDSDSIDGNEILCSMKKFGIDDGKVFAFQTIDSINTEAKRRASESGNFRLPDGTFTKGGALLNKTVFVTGEQTAGRGRMGRVFYSPKNTGLYLSFIYSPKHGVTNPAIMTASAAVAVCRAVEYCYKVPCSLKWVNDVFANGKKVCGILTEGIINSLTSKVEAAIVGIGINISDGDFPAEISSVAGSILGAKKSDGGVESRNALAAFIVSELIKIYDAADSAECGQKYSPLSVISEYRKRSFLIGHTVSINPLAGMSGAPYKCKVIDVDSEAGLVVELADGERRTLRSGEVSLHSDLFTK